MGKKRYILDIVVGLTIALAIILFSLKEKVGPFGITIGIISLAIAILISLFRKAMYDILS